MLVFVLIFSFYCINFLFPCYKICSSKESEGENLISFYGFEFSVFLVCIHTNSE